MQENQKKKKKKKKKKAETEREPKGKVEENRGPETDVRRNNVGDENGTFTM